MSGPEPERRAPFRPVRDRTDHDRSDRHPTDHHPTDHELEEQAEEVGGRGGSTHTGPHTGAHTGPHTDAVRGDGSVSAALRAPIERWAGVDLAGVRVRHGGPAASRTDVRAAAVADTVYVPPDAHASGPLADRVLRHELVHVAQQRHAGPAHPARRGLPQFNLCSSSPPSGYKKLKAGEAITNAEAVKVVEYYDDLADGEKEKAVDELHSLRSVSSGVRRLLDALTPEQRTEKMSVLTDLLQRLQNHATRSEAGRTDEQLAQLQGAFMEAQAQADALKKAQADAAAAGAPPPATVTPAQKGAAHRATVDKNTVPPTVVNAWDALIPADKTNWNARAKTAIDAVVAIAKKRAPTMPLTAANIRWDPAVIAARGQNVFSLAGNPMTVGMGFVAAAEANPEYVLGSVLHEIYGHPEYEGSDRKAAPEWRIYRRAADAHFPSYVKPASDRDELDTYSYLGTEIAAEMREFQYTVPITPADATKGISGSDDPATDIKDRVRRIHDLYDPVVGWSLVVGMHERFRVDPRITPAALKLFTDAVAVVFTGKKL